MKIGDAVSKTGYLNGGVPQRTLSGPKHFLVHINDLQTPCPIYKYVGDSTIFEICNQDMVSVIQDSADLVEQWSCNNDMRIKIVSEMSTDSSPSFDLAIRQDTGNYGQARTPPNINFVLTPVQQYSSRGRAGKVWPSAKVGPHRHSTAGMECSYSNDTSIYRPVREHNSTS